MNDGSELRRRLRAIIDERYGGVVRQASQALGLDPNSLQTILDAPHREPRLSTLVAMSDTFHWPLMNVVSWAIGREPPMPTDRQAMLAQCLTTIGLDEDGRAAVIQIVMRMLDRSAPNGK